MPQQPSSSTLSSRYQKFRDPLCRGGWPGADFGKMPDEDGSTLYETEYGALIHEIIKLNDVAALNRYQAANPMNTLGVWGTPVEDDPFWTAAAYGSTDALRMLLMHWDASDPSTRRITAPDKRRYGLLQTACGHTQIETVRFLLDGPWQATYGDIHARDGWGYTALLAAAASLEVTRYEKSRASVQSHLVHADEIMHLLLDRGAHVQDVRLWNEEPHNTVLSSSICQTSPALVKRLINQGVDVYMKTTYEFLGSYIYGGFERDTFKDVTSLHIGSLYSNVEGIQVLLDHARSTGRIEIVTQFDERGRLPLHWAAVGPEHEFRTLEEEDIILRTVATIELLLAADPNSINIRDKQGNTALHYAVRTHSCRGSRHVKVIQTLCNHGADASIRGQNGETVLHGLGFRIREGEPIETSLIDLLLEYGASVDDTDKDCNTPLHFAAKNLPRIEAARYLVEKGADVSAVNRQGNTPLHQAAGGTPFAFRFGLPISKGSKADDHIRALEEMIKVLLHRVSRETADALMVQPNADNKTPRQLCEEIKRRWRDSDEAERKRALEQSLEPGRGRGR